MTPERRVRPKTVTQTWLTGCLVASATTTLRKTQDPVKRAPRYGAKMSIPMANPVRLQRMYSRRVDMVVPRIERGAQVFDFTGV
jgi:hypothetical protein